MISCKLYCIYKHTYSVIWTAHFIQPHTKNLNCFEFAIFVIWSRSYSCNLKQPHHTFRDYVSLDLRNESNSFLLIEVSTKKRTKNQCAYRNVAKGFPSLFWLVILFTLVIFIIMISKIVKILCTMKLISTNIYIN